MPDAATQQILVIDENAVLYPVLREAIQPVAAGAPAGPGALKLAVAAKDSEGLALARQSRGEQKPFPLAIVGQKVRAGATGLEAALQLWRDDPLIQIIVCPAAEQKLTAAMLQEKFGDSDRVVLLLPPYHALCFRQIIPVLLTRRRLEEKALGGGRVVDPGAETAVFRLNQVRGDFDETQIYERSLLDTFMKNVPDGVFFKDLESRYVRCSHALAQRLGLDRPRDIAGKSDFDFFSEEHALASFADDQEVIRTGQPILARTVEEMYPDGTCRWVLTSRIPWRNAEDRVIGTFGVSKDITTLKQAEDELGQHRDLLQALLDHMPDRIYFKNTQSRFVKVSRAMAARFGVDNPEQLIGKTDFDFHAPELARQFALDEELVMASGKPLVNKVEEQRNPEGGRIWALVTKVPVYDRMGQVTGLIGISRDITDLKRTEEKLNQTHEELVIASRQAGMAEVATGVLHNVGNVLNSVNVSSNLVSDLIRRSKVANLERVCGMLKEHADTLGDFLAHDEKGRQIPGFLEKLAAHFKEEQESLLRELEQMRKNVDHIRDIVATQQGYAQMGGTLEVVDLPEIIEHALRMEGSSIARHVIQIERRFGPTPKITTEKHKLMQVLLNLVRNAKQAMIESPKKRLTLTTESPAPDRVRISVTDNGIGIAKTNLTKMFSYGFSTKKGGHGFGLHSSALAVTEMGGTIVAHSDGPGTGATFVVELPVKFQENKP